MRQIRVSLLLQKNVTGEDHQNKFGTILLKKTILVSLLAP